VIPPFDSDNKLPPGVHWATWQEFATRFGWSPYRSTLLAGLRAALRSLRAAGCRTAYIDGSFITRERYPNDFDGCWDMAGVDLDQVDPVLFIFKDGCAAQKAKYYGELWSAQFTELGSGQTFLDFFQTDKETGAAKGIVALKLQEMAL
jgi:hypothetical protein